MTTPKNAIHWFEIPATDLARATRFYEHVLGIKLRQEDFMNTPMAVFVTEDKEGIAGALVVSPNLRPHADGSLVYLNAGTDLDGAIQRASAAGGQVILGKTDIGPPGFIAIVKDTEGNRVGLHMPA